MVRCLFGYRLSPCAWRRIAGISLVALFWTAPLAAAPGPSEPVRERESLILLLALPPDVTREDVLTGEQPTLSGVFGVIDGANEGSVTIRFLEGPTIPVTVPVHNGVFSAPWFGPTRGRFLAVFRDPAGRVVGARRFNKDASDYFVAGSRIDPGLCDSRVRVWALCEPRTTPP
jgi:hypothetical protein